MADYKNYKAVIDGLETKERQLSQEIQSLIYKNTTNAVEN